MVRAVGTVDLIACPQGERRTDGTALLADSGMRRSMHQSLTCQIENLLLESASFGSSDAQSSRVAMIARHGASGVRSVNSGMNNLLPDRHGRARKNSILSRSDRLCCNPEQFYTARCVGSAGGAKGISRSSMNSITRSSGPYT